jgi:hypothetical protein
MSAPLKSRPFLGFVSCELGRVMYAQLGFVFWGLLVIILDFDVNGFDLLPDILGYALVALGCARLVSLSPRFRVAASQCWVLALLWLLGFVVADDVDVLYSVAVTALNCTMMWFLLGGIADTAFAHSRPDLAERARNRRAAYVALMIAAQILPFVIAGRSAIGVPLVVVLVGSTLVLMVLILHLVQRVRVELFG